MEHKEISVEEFIGAIEKLPNHEIKHRWLAWLREYETPGYYERQPEMHRSAKFAYNHLANPQWLIWLIRASGVDQDLATLAELDSSQKDNLHQKCALIRKRVPWIILEKALWG
jgi:hypothetical protein